MGQVVDRVGLLLAGFTHEEPKLSLGECAQRAGLSKSSTHRLLGSLADIGLLERDTAGQWQIGELPLQLAAIRLSHRSMKSEATMPLKQLGERFHAATAFSVPRGTEMVYVERTQSVEPYGPSAQLGSTATMWAGASGRAVLACYPPPVRLQRLSSPAWNALDHDTQTRLLDEIEISAERGYAVDRGEYFEGVAGVAAALGSTGDPAAAMSLMVRPDQMTPDLEREMGRALKELADDVTRRTTLPMTPDAEN